MQPEQQLIFPEAIIDQVTTDNHDNPSQHGFNSGTGIYLPSAARYDAVGGPGQIGNAISDVTNAATRRLSTAINTSPARNRIEEYERASLPNGPKESAALSVVATTNGTCPIAMVPNELLTHVLAHLSPYDLTATALVSRRFHTLVTTPHAWRSAFARYFVGPESIQAVGDGDGDQTIVKSERRAFTRLTPKASWRSEYVLRTRLLRSLARGKPVQVSTGTGGTQASRARLLSPEITYSSELLGSITHIHATWQVGPNKRAVRFVHGADDLGTASLSDPLNAKVERWGFADAQLFLQFSELNPGDTLYGLGPGEIVGVPNSMSVSQPYGLIYGQGFPGGFVYFRSNEEMRGRFLLSSSTSSAPRLGVPGLSFNDHSITSVWIAKSNAVPSLTDGLIGMLSGSSAGVLTAYSIGSLGATNNRTARFTRGEMTARWVLSPGVPLIAIVVDNEHSLKRQAENRIWAVVLNALGEVFFITKFPRRARVEQDRVNDEEFTAWMTGRSVYWNLAEPSRRTARPDPYNESPVDGSYSPRSSWNGMCLSSAQIEAETHEIETFARKLPKDIQKSCLGWDMRRKLEVDFAGDNADHAGEAVVVFECGHEDGSTAAVTRYTRLRVQDKNEPSSVSTPSLTSASTPPSASPSLFGGGRSPVLAHPTPLSIDRPVSSIDENLDETTTPRPMVEEWRESRLTFGGMKKIRITTTTIDLSAHAVQTQSEDPLLNVTDVSATSSPSLGPWSQDGPAQTTDVPGQRARFMAMGTQTGSIFVWNIRDPTSKSADLVNDIEPVRIIFTDSPQISSLAVSSLYLVHGGSDGLVQAWDVLASDTHAIRTLNSRFSSRARRQLIQAQASPHGVGTNMYAAGAICLDPDPTVIRGVVSLGNRLRYWAYSSSAADQYKSSKRRLRRSERGSNQVGERFSGVTRSNLKDYIASERFELERERQQRQKESDHIAGRFGTELLDGSEEEMIAYASMLSQETLELESIRRSSDPISVTGSATFGESGGIATTPPTSSPSTRGIDSRTDEELDADIAEAIRQSLQSAPSTPVYDVAFRPAKTKGRKGSSTKASPSPSPVVSSSRAVEKDDLDFAIQLSLAEEASRNENPSSQGRNGKQRQM